MATVNGEPISFDGRTLEQIGQDLYRAFPGQEGAGLNVVLTDAEQDVFESIFGMKIGYALSELVADAVRAAGKAPNFNYRYTNNTFSTMAN